MLRNSRAAWIAIPSRQGITEFKRIRISDLIRHILTHLRHRQPQRAVDM
jgi:hypothetical protein